MQNKLFLKAADICELLEVKQTSAYEIIGNLNKELEEQGYLTLFLSVGIKRWTESEKYGKICIRNDIMKSEVGGYTHENCNH